MALAGSDKNGKLVRWIDGERYPRNVNFSHIYPILGWPPGKPHMWVAAEPTLQVPLGYDVSVHGVDFDHHGRASARPVTLSADGIALVGPANATSAAATSGQSFAGPPIPHKTYVARSGLYMYGALGMLAGFALAKKLGK